MIPAQTILAAREGAKTWWGQIDNLLPYPVPDASPFRPELVFLRHIIDHYDNLAETTIFLHSDARRHCHNILDRIRFLPEPCDFLTFGSKLLVNRVTTTHRQMLEQLRGDLDDATACEFVSCLSGSLFVCSRDRLRSRPIEFYRRLAKLSSQSVHGATLLEQNWHRILDGTSGRQGIVTAADKSLFHDLQFMIRSLRACDSTPVMVYDLGLSHDQLHWCLSQPGVSARPLPPMSESLAGYVGEHRWQAWLKPTYIRDAPFDRILWIDADCVILSPLGEAFDLIDEGPLLMPEVAIGCGANHLDLYARHLPIRDPARRGGAEMNNGVIGFDRIRDRQLLDAWLYAVQWAVEHPELRHLIRWYDQGALLWATLCTENESFIRNTRKWNYPADATAGLLSRAFRKGGNLLEAIRETHPHAGIVHWFGLVKLSVALQDEIQARFTSDITCSQDEFLQEADPMHLGEEPWNSAIN